WGMVGSGRRAPTTGAERIPGADPSRVRRSHSQRARPARQIGCRVREPLDPEARRAGDVLNAAHRGVAQLRAEPCDSPPRSAERVSPAERHPGAAHLRTISRRRVTCVRHMIRSMDSFSPRPVLSSGHLMTLYGWGNPRYFPRLPSPTIRYFDVEARARVLAHCHWQPQAWERPAILLLHGLKASSDAHYMRGIADKAFARGISVIRLNQRNCGGTEHLSEGLFHSGLTADARHVIDELVSVDGLSSIAVAGYSLGGNLALKLAAEYASQPPRALCAVAAVSPIIEIGECVRSLERRE